MVLPVPVEVVPNLPDDLARDWWGLGTWALIVTGFVVSLTILYKIKNQVVNGHTTPMRSDIDGLRDGQVQIMAEVLSLGGELRAERSERRADIDAIHAKLDEHRKALPGG